MATLREKSAMVNIARTSTQIDDPHYYRYKMPLLQVIPGGQISKKKRGKTISANMSKVAKSLHRTLDELGKYLGCELATSATSAEDGTMLLGGHFDAKILQNLIPGYVEIFVLCPTCHLPETMYEISTKKKRIYHKCSACGSRNAINETDHKVYRYILAQSLHNDKSSKKKKKKKTRTKQTRDQDDLVEVNTTKQQHRMSKDEYEADCDLEEWALTIAVHTTHRKIREQKTLNPQQLAQFVSKEQMIAGLEKHMRLHILVQSAISPDTFLHNKEIERYAPVISILTKGGKLELERHLIAALEVVCKDASPKGLLTCHDVETARRGCAL